MTFFVSDGRGGSDSETITVTVSEVDDDADGISDLWELQYFSSIADCVPGDDPDADGLTNLEEYGAGTHPLNADTDGDGYSDKDEVDEGTDPTDPDSFPTDFDHDGIPDAWETRYFATVDDCVPDEDPDADGLTNLREYEAGTDPRDPDTDGDGIPDGADNDPLHGPEPFHGSGGGCGTGVVLAAVLLAALFRRADR